VDTVPPHADQATASSETLTPRRGIAITITTRTMWVAALIALAILVALFVILRAQGPIVLLVLAIILGEAIRPLVARLNHFHIPGPLAVLMIYLAMLLVVGILLWLLLSPPQSPLERSGHVDTRPATVSGTTAG
jgi:HAMP domain-containing protein